MNAELTNTRKRTRLDRKFDRLRDAEEAGKLGVLALKVYADHNLHLIARSINYTVEAAVVFDDPGAATEALALIASTEAVAEARVYTADGELLAQWQRPENGLLSRVEMLDRKSVV